MCGKLIYAVVIILSVLAAVIVYVAIRGIVIGLIIFVVLGILKLAGVALPSIL